MKVLLLLTSILYSLASVAQPLEEKSFTRFTTAAGLSSNEVSGIRQDKRGYLWIATASGINRFDGIRFRPFHSNDDTASPASEELSAAVWLDKQHLGFYSASGLHIINTETGTTRNLFVPFKKQQYLYKFNTIHGAKSDPNGNIYLLTRSGFYHFKDDKLVMRFDYYKEEELNNTHFHFGGSLFEFDTDRLLIVSAEGMFIYHKKNRTIKKLDKQASPFLAGLSWQRFRALLFLQPSPGQFLILKQSSDSLFHLNTITGKVVISRLPFIPADQEFHYRTRLFQVGDTSYFITGHHTGFFKLGIHPQSGAVSWDPRKYFRAYMCRAILKDREGRLWIGTHKGLFRQDLHMQGVETVTLPQGWADSFPALRITDIMVKGDRLYAGTSGDAGLLRFSKNPLRYEKQLLIDPKNRSFNQVVALAHAGKEQLLLGTYGGMVLFDTQSEKVRPLPFATDTVGWINDIQEDGSENIWIAGSYNIASYRTSTRNLAIVPVQKHLLNLPVYLAQDRTQQMWMASHGLARYNSNKKGFDFFVDSFPFIKMPDRQVAALLFDTDDNLWFNSPNNGLISYNNKTKKFGHYTNRNGLPDNNVLALLQVGNKLWIACPSGIACLDLYSKQIVSFGPQNGFPDAPLIKGCRFHYDSAAKQVYIGYSTSLVRFNPDALLQRKSPPQTFIESVVIGGRQTLYLPGQSLQTSWKDKELRIIIGSINYNGGIQRYAYRVVESETTRWTDIGTQPSFSIANLSAGTHRIEVKTYAPNNAWPPQVAALDLSVKPPLWETPAFRLLAVIGLLATLYLFTRWRINLARRKEMVKTQLEKLKADNYKNQFELEQISHYFSSSLANKKTEEEVLWDVAQNLIGQMHYEECVLYGWNKARTRMVQKAAHGPKGKPGIIMEDGFEVEFGQGIVGAVMLSKEPILVKDTRLDKRYRVDDAFRLSEITVPILHNNELLGVIDSEHHKLGYFTERDLKVLTTIATLIGNKLRQLESEQTLEIKKKELATINEQLAEARLSALQAQMNPHFVFNALNSIKRMILDEDNDMASRYLSKFALMIRMTLEHSKDIFVTLDENIEYISNYLAMEQLRFGDSFSYHITVDETLDVEETVLPSMMIQPLVENAIWHGLMQSEKEKKVRISFSREEEKVVCTVTDNGIGIHRAEMLKRKQRPVHRSVGLENLKKRIRIINEKFETACTLEIGDLGETSGKEQGTRAVLSLNVINTNYKI